MLNVSLYFFSSISTMASISTDTPSGRALVPTADLACVPFSPNTSPRRLEHPLITMGCSVKPSTQLTKPTSFTIRLTRSRSPR